MERIVRHYHRSGLIQAISAMLTSSGKDIGNLTLDDLTFVDEFHIGGRRATLELFNQMPLEKDMKILDIGSGIGGPARLLAEQFEVRVTGIDLVAAYVEVADWLSGRTGLVGKTSFCTGSAIDLPFANESMDGAYSIHVAMNIEDKARHYAEAFRTVRAGGFFAIYDVMSGSNGSPDLPAPWAERAALSFVSSKDQVRQHLSDAGFQILSENNRTLQSYKELKNRQMAGKTPSLSLAPLMGENMNTKIENMIKSIEDERLETHQIVCHRP